MPPFEIPNIIKKVLPSLGGLPLELRESEEFFHDASHEQGLFAHIWYRNIAYYMGFQWLDNSQNTQFLSLAQMPSWKVRLVINLIMPTIRTEAAKILKINPSFTAVPGNDSDEARQSSRVGGRILESKYYEDNFQRRLYNLVMWMLTCGSSYLWTNWDESAAKSWSEQIKNPETQQIETKQFRLGDVVDEVTGPFEALLEAFAPEDFDDNHRIMRVKIMDVDRIEDKWGVKVPAESINHQTHFRGRLGSLAGIHSFGIAQPQRHTNRRKMALVKYDYQLPSGKYPRGFQAIYANGVVIRPPRELETFHAGKIVLPVSKYDHITIPGRAQGMSNIEQIGPLNVAYNKMNSGALENANQLSRPKIIAPQGSLDDDSWTDQPGEVVEYVPIGGLGPSAMTPPQMPTYYFQLMDSFPGKISDVSGIQDVSRGKLPRRATSGKAIDLLQDADDTRMGLTIKNFGSSLERSTGIKLGLMKRKYSEERITSRVGAAHGIEVMRFKAADLKDTDTVRVVMTPALSRAAKVQVGMKLGEIGLVPGDTALKIMELGDLNIAFDKDSEQKQFAKFENFQMSRGEVIEPAPYEPHDVHLEEHTEFLRRWGPKLSIETRQLIQQHIEITKELAMISALPGGPPTAGAPTVTPGGPV